MLYVFYFFVMCYIIFHFEAKRVYICLYLESVKYAWNALCFLIFFAMCYIIFHFEATRVYILYLESVKYSGMLYVFLFFCHVLHNFPF